MKYNHRMINFISDLVTMSAIMVVKCMMLHLVMKINNPKQIQVFKTITEAKISKWIQTYWDLIKYLKIECMSSPLPLLSCHLVPLGSEVSWPFWWTAWNRSALDRETHNFYTHFKQLMYLCSRVRVSAWTVFHCVWLYSF